MQKIFPSDLMPMDWFLDKEPIAIDLVYCSAVHPRNIFNVRVYKADARLWVHRDLAVIIIGAARALHKAKGWTLELKDCLRTIEAQDIMLATDIVQQNLHWLEGPDMLLSPPGRGGHPRAIAIDVCVKDERGHAIDMGTEFDEMVEAASRSFDGLSEDIQANRAMLENAFLDTAKALSLPLYPLGSEWWDFRFPIETLMQYAPLSDRDLPLQMQMTGQFDTPYNDFSEEHFDKLGQDILYRLDESLSITHRDTANG